MPIQALESIVETYLAQRDEKALCCGEAAVNHSGTARQ